MTRLFAGLLFRGLEYAGRLFRGTGSTPTPPSQPAVEFDAVIVSAIVFDAVIPEVIEFDAVIVQGE